MSRRDLLDTPVAGATPAHAKLLLAELAVTRELRRLARESQLSTKPPPPEVDLPARWGFHPSQRPGASR